MKPLPGVKGGPAVPLLIGGGVVALVSISPLPGKDGSLLLSLLFWVAIAQGCVAAVAAGTLVNARWTRAVGTELLSVAPLLLLGAFLFLLLAPFAASYPWAGRPELWFRKEFFIGRNFVLFLLAYAAARRFAAGLAGDGDGTAARAATYLFVFVASQSLSAYDLVMSLEYPWYSTLFGGYFFIEALQGGFAVAAILCALLPGTHSGGGPDGRSPLSDVAILIFGFSLLWAGFFFAQYLTIWYGNLPEEVSYILKRVSTSPVRELGAAVVVLLFFVPFPVLLSTPAKSSRGAVCFVSICILVGILVERYVFLAPDVRVGLSALAVDFLCLLFLFVLVVYRRVRGNSLEA